MRPQLSAFHDEALSVEERIAIAGHLRDCPACEVEAEDLRTIREALRGAAAAVQTDWNPELSWMPFEVLERVKAERTQSLASRAARLWDDPRRLWTTCGAVVVSTSCAMLVVGVLAQAARSGALSLATAVQSLLEARPARAFGPVILPRVNSDAVMPVAVMSEMEGDDAVSAFTAVVTPDGNLVDVQLLEPDDPAVARQPQRQRLKSGLLAAAATARFEPARITGAPVAVNVVWLLAHTTVRAKLVEPKPGPWVPGDPIRNGRPPRA
ncbi:MAG: zf-HC2 domain-containing protein, partial [Candidatus Krumholzibacteria bacterium]|nr:zf-HC2 domain-containing protein [Candidatus Krumholzibacteria bacterium]